MTLSLPKCNSLITSIRQKMSHEPNYIPLSAVLDGCPVPCSTKILEVLVDNVLSSEDHIKKVCQKIIRNLYLLHQVKARPPSTVSRKLFVDNYIWSQLTTAVLYEVTAQSDDLGKKTAEKSSTYV